MGMIALEINPSQYSNFELQDLCKAIRQASVINEYKQAKVDSGLCAFSRVELHLLFWKISIFVI